MTPALDASGETNATRLKGGKVAVRNLTNPRLWKTAMVLAKGDAKRITVESYTLISVLVAED